ncbi:MAG: DUF5103 domain-containing protein [Bacteroidales bacterium]|nr:DUF5103 domain-containing protein [Bacteroidales bacterium]
MTIPIRCILILSIFSLAFQNISAQKDDYYNKEGIKYSNRTYIPNILSLQIYPESYPLDEAIIQLGSNDKLQISFDDLDGGIKTYMYTFIHCDALWNPSLIQAPEYIDGFYDDEIRDYAHSFNTTTTYTHYSYVFPNQYMRPRISGNYLMVIYMDDINAPVATARFMVSESLVRIDKLKVKRSGTASLMRTHQEIDFSIFPGSFNIPAPGRDLKVMILQNNRWDNAIKTIPPKNIRIDELDFDYDDLNNFEAGNEFRNFDIKSLRYNSEFVAAIRFDEHFDVYLKPSFVKTFKPYYSEQDINGKRLIKTEDMDRSDIEADYAMVHFILPMEYPFAMGSLYVFGALTYWDFLPEARMNYNYDKHQYECNLFLKQGYYNYCYAIAEPGKNAASLSVTEGNHFETENAYSILVYYRQPGQLYDRLIAVSNTSSIVGN